MRRLLFLFTIALGALVVVPTSFADTPLFSTTNSPSGLVQGGTTYFIYHDSFGSTKLTRETHGAQRKLVVAGYWYFPNTPGGAGGLSHDGKTLLLVNVEDKSKFAHSSFLVIDSVRMKVSGKTNPYTPLTKAVPFALTDALSPDGSRLYAVPYTDVVDGIAEPCNEYVYNLRSHHAVSATGSRAEGGTATGRAASADGRWVYTLYRTPSDTSFVQALDTVGASVHCHDLPATGGVDLAALSLSANADTLVVSSQDGTPKLDIGTAGWSISKAPPPPFPWGTLAAWVGGAFLLLGGVLLLWRRWDRDRR